MTHDCSGPLFDGLKNPYSGDPLRPKMTVTSSGSSKLRFFAPDTYSPTDPQPTARDAYRLWNRVDGVEGLKDGRPVTCAYLGTPMKLEHDERGWWYSGGLNVRLMRTREDFLSLVTMRDGKPTREVQKEPPSRVEAPPRRGKVTARMKKHADDARPELSDDAVHTAEKVVKKTLAQTGGRR